MSAYITPLIIKDFFKLILEDYLGTYTYPNNYVEPSITIGNPTNNIVAKGLEIILPIMPDLITFQLTETLYKNDEYNIYLVQRSGVNNIPRAVEIITQYLWSARGKYIPSFSIKDSLPSYCLTVSFPTLVDTIYYETTK